MANPRDNRKIRILIVDDIAETRDNLKKLLYFEDDVEVVGVASNGREGVGLADQLHPDIVLMDINMPGMDGISASEAISEQHPDIQVVMMSVQGEADYLRRSMLAGAREFLIKPFSSEELVTSVRRVYQLALTRRANAPVAPAYPQGQPPPNYIPAPKPKTGKIVTVYSPKGGAGVSTIAANLAVALKEVTKERVAIVDGSFQFGDVGVLLNLPGNRSIADAADSKNQPDEDLLNGIMLTHSTGVRALLSPPRPEMADLITPENLKSILALLQKMFDYIVVDTAKTVNDVQMSILDVADQILLVSTADITGLKDIKLLFELTDALGYPESKMSLVLSRYDPRNGITTKDIEGNIKHSVASVIPRDERAVNGAVNRGIPFVLSQSKAPVSRAVIELARSIVESAEQPEPQAAAKAATTAARADKSKRRADNRIGEPPKRKWSVLSIFSRG